MRYVSLFSGIEAASVAWRPLGWEPLAFSEIDAFPSAVLADRYPTTPNLGDITRIDWNQHDDCLTAGLVVGGSPCQSFSIAGRREGLEGASGLMWEYVRAIQAIRPQWLVWENVPGALSSSHGEDFRCLLESLDGLGYGLAWRVLDAQFFGVAQRRRRVYVVGSLGSTCACEVLFEPDCLRWDHPTGRAKRQALTRGFGGGACGADAGPGCLTPWDSQSRRVYDTDGCYPTLDTRKRSGGDGRAVAFLPNAGGKAGGIAYERELSPTLKTEHNPAVLTSGRLLFAFAAKNAASAGLSVSRDTSPTLSTTKQPAVSGDGTVRRLTPVECERLQGFPDGWTDVPYRGREHAPDSPRYKALGNSMAVPVMRWIGRRIQQVEEVDS